MTTLWIYGIRAGQGLIEDVVKIIMIHILQKRTLDNEVTDALNRVPNDVVVEICTRVVASERVPEADYEADIMFLVISTMCSRSFTRAFISCHSAMDLSTACRHRSQRGGRCRLCQTVSGLVSLLATGIQGGCWPDNRRTGRRCDTDALKGTVKVGS